MGTTAIAQVYDRLDAALLAHAQDPQGRWIASEMREHPEDELLISVATASATVFVGAADIEDGAATLREAQSELGVQRIDLRGREDLVTRLRALLTDVALV